MAVLVMLISTLAHAQQPAPGAAPAQATQGAEPGGSIFVRGDVGFDPIGSGMAFGGGIGYRFSGAQGSREVVLDYFRSSSSERGATSSDGQYRYDSDEQLSIFAARFDLLPHVRAGYHGGFWILGSGFFVANYKYKESGVALDAFGNVVYTYSDPPIDATGGGWVLDAGVGYTFGQGLEARLEIPVLIFFGTQGEESAVAIPIQASLAWVF